MTSEIQIEIQNNSIQATSFENVVRVVLAILFSPYSVKFNITVGSNECHCISDHRQIDCPSTPISKKTLKLRISGPLWSNPRWIPFTKGQ